MACPWYDALVKTQPHHHPGSILNLNGTTRKKIWQIQNEAPSTKPKASSRKTYQCCEMQRRAEDCFLMKGDWRHVTDEHKDCWMGQTLNQRKQCCIGHCWHKQWNLTADQIGDYRATPMGKSLNVIIPRQLRKRYTLKHWRVKSCDVCNLCKSCMLKHWRIKSHDICNLCKRYMLKLWRLKSREVCNLLLNGWKNEQLSKYTPTPISIAIYLERMWISK